MSNSRILNWPKELERTPEIDRTAANKFNTNFNRTQADIRTEMERMGVDEWRFDHVSGSGGDPGVVVRWRNEGRDYAVACDAYKFKKSNARALYLWIKETRMREKRPVATAQDAFAAAALPPADEADVIEAPSKQPHEVLGVAPDAPDEVIEAAARSLKKKFHPDSDDGDAEKFSDVNKAERLMLGQ